ncbi:HEAT repeat domain-containing protein [bacterium]|nr:HEAT repeat domain-containing protein [bacterium]
MTFEEIKKALTQPNSALKKRALAVLYNDEMVEAKSLLESYVGSEVDPDLQTLAIKVLNKLRESLKGQFQFDLEKVRGAFQSRDNSQRISALRTLLTQRSPKIPKLVQDLLPNETSPEAISLIVEILKNNPDPGNLPLLLKFSNDPSDAVRMEALQGVVNIMNGCMYPFILRALLDPSPPLKMKAYQLISMISRANLLDSIDFMLGSESAETSRLAGQLLPPFVGPDLLPLLKKNINHKDEETRALCKRALVIMSQKGNSEATKVLESLSASTVPPSSVQSSKAILESTMLSSDCQRHFERYPGWLTKPLNDAVNSREPKFALGCIWDFFEKLLCLLIPASVCAYFFRGNRSQYWDSVFFDSIQKGSQKTDPAKIIQTLPMVLPLSTTPDDLFPFILASKVQNDENSIVENFLSIREGFSLYKENPQESARFLKPAFETIESLLDSFSFITKNWILVKVMDNGNVRMYDFLKNKPVPINPALLSNFEFPLNVPILVSGNFSSALQLSPFLGLDKSRSSLVRIDPNEQELWEFLKKYRAMEDYMSFLKKGNSPY